MPGRFRPPHQSGRRHPFPRVNIDGCWFGQGKQQADQVSGWLFPANRMVKQRGGLVSPRPKDGSFDVDESW
jgi:hypothetical protein